MPKDANPRFLPGSDAEWTGLFLFGVAFVAPAFNGLIFTLGILAVCLAMAIPMFRSQWRTNHNK